MCRHITIDKGTKLKYQKPNTKKTYLRRQRESFFVIKSTERLVTLDLMKFDE